MKSGDRLLWQLTFMLSGYEMSVGVAVRRFAPYTFVFEGGWTCALWPAGAVHRYRTGEYGISVEWFGAYLSVNARRRS